MPLHVCTGHDERTHPSLLPRRRILFVYRFMVVVIVVQLATFVSLVDAFIVEQCHLCCPSVAHPSLLPHCCVWTQLLRLGPFRCLPRVTYTTCAFQTLKGLQIGSRPIIMQNFKFLRYPSDPLSMSNRPMEFNMHFPGELASS